MSVLELRDVHRVHGSGETAVHALRGVTLSVDAGELVAVMGPSGSGKSTLLNLAGGLDQPSRGDVVVEGTPLDRCSRRALAALRRRRVGYVFQDLNLLASLAGPAFAVGARRRRRELALVAATGGTPAHVRRIVLADGVVLGALAAAAGVLLDIGAAAALRPVVEDLSNIRSGGFRVFPVALLALAGLAVVTGVLAALVPAWISSRQNVVNALAGRRRSPGRVGAGWCSVPP